MDHPADGCRDGRGALEDLVPPGEAEVQNAFSTASAIFPMTWRYLDGYPSGATDILT